MLLKGAPFFQIRNGHLYNQDRQRAKEEYKAGRRLHSSSQPFEKALEIDRRSAYSKIEMCQFSLQQQAMDHGSSHVLISLRFGTAIVGVVLFVLYWVLRNENNIQEHYKLPPGPRPWPVVGNVPHLRPLLHQALAAMANKYGDLVYLRLGCQNIVAVCSSKRAEEILKTNDRVFAGRPQNTVTKHCFNDGQGIVFNQYGSSWRNNRKITALELLSPKRLQNFQKLRKDCVLMFLRSILNDCEGGKSSRIDDHIYKLVVYNITGMTLGEKFHGQGSAAHALRGSYRYKDLMVTYSKLGTAFVASDYFPSLRNFDLLGYRKRMIEAAKQNHDILDRILDEHEERRLKSCVSSVDKDKQDFVDALMTQPATDDGKALSRGQIKAILQDIYMGAMESSIDSLGWTFSELLRQPRIIRKAQEELDAVVGRDRLVEETDLPRLPYVRAIVNETFRLHPALPIVPHVTLEDCILEGQIYIPRSTTVLVNSWAIGRDATIWENPLNFNPDRFLGADDGHLSGKHYHFLPFGSGRRICPGRFLGSLFVEYSLAAMLHACNWTLPQGMRPEDLDMQELPGLSVSRANPLKVVASSRLQLSAVISTQ